ncbi:MAG: phosphoribosyltransferase [Campylobacterales bacterium]|nr:phosphoribosyltransferase [Campylobacterales bacterium]
MKQYYSYDSFRQDTLKLLVELKKLELDTIVGIARGGLTLAHAISEGLSLRSVQTLQTQLYDGEEKRDFLTLEGSCQLKGKKKVLVVDDIADSGETFKAVMEYLEHHYPEIEFFSAALFYKKSSCYEPHYWINEANCWIEFFWEVDFLEK